MAVIMMTENIYSLCAVSLKQLESTDVCMFPPNTPGSESPAKTDRLNVFLVVLCPRSQFVPTAPWSTKLPEASLVRHEHPCTYCPQLSLVITNGAFS